MGSPLMILLRWFHSLMISSFWETQGATDFQKKVRKASTAFFSVINNYLYFQSQLNPIHNAFNKHCHKLTFLQLKSAVFTYLLFLLITEEKAWLEVARMFQSKSLKILEIILNRLITMGKSTFMTGVAIANSMVGSSMIIFPVSFNDTGIVINVIFVFLMSAVMALTCKLLVSHLQPDEQDIGKSIKRKLGPTFGFLFGFLSSITLFLVSSVFFLLAVDVFYDFFYGVIGEMSLSQKGFKLIFLGLFAALNFLPDLKYVFKLTSVAMGALICSTLTLIVSIPFNHENINGDFLSFKGFSALDLLAVASINGFAFICHPSVSPMVKEHDDQKNNAKAVYYGYAITTVLYLIVGVLGSLSIYGKVPKTKKEHYNIIDYFEGEAQAPIIGILNFFYLFLISPIFPFVSKNQALQLIPAEKKQQIPKIWLKATVIFAILWIPLNIVFILLDTSPNVVIGFISTVMAYYVTYFLPIFMTFKVGDYIAETASENLEASLIVQDEQINRKQVSPHYVAKSDYQTTATNQKTNYSLLTEGEIQNQQKQPISKIEKGLYLAVITYGSVMLILQLISFVL